VLHGALDPRGFGLKGRANQSRRAVAARHLHEDALSRAIVTIIGSDRVGIIAGIANVLSDANVNILDISQSVIREYFTMIMMVDSTGSVGTFDELSRKLAQKGEQLGVRVEIQREEIFQAMHRI